MNKMIETIPSSATDALRVDRWPGNIRELQNVIERAVILSTGAALAVDVADLRPTRISGKIQKAAVSKPTTAGAVHNVPEETDGNISSAHSDGAIGLWPAPTVAAARLAKKRSTLQLRIRKLGIARPIV